MSRWDLTSRKPCRHVDLLRVKCWDPFSITVVVSRPLAAGLQQPDTGRRSFASPVTVPIGDERRRSAPHITPLLRQLRRGLLPSMQSWVQMSPRVCTFIPHCRTLSDGKRRGSSATICVPARLCHWSSSHPTVCAVGDRAFSVAAAHVWNSLPQHNIGLFASSVAVFRSRLKTHLFNISYTPFTRSNKHRANVEKMYSKYTC